MWEEDRANKREGGGGKWALVARFHIYFLQGEVHSILVGLSICTTQSPPSPLVGDTTYSACVCDLTTLLSSQRIRPHHAAHMYLCIQTWIHTPLPPPFTTMHHPLRPFASPGPRNQTSLECAFRLHRSDWSGELGVPGRDIIRGGICGCGVGSNFHLLSLRGEGGGVGRGFFFVGEKRHAFVCASWACGVGFLSDGGG